MRPRPEPAGPDQESAWDYPRPPIAEPFRGHIVIEHAGTTVTDTRGAVRTLETSHPPSYYIPPADIAPGVLRRAAGSSFCERKGWAVYWDAVVGDLVVPRVGWSYPDPTAPIAYLRFKTDNADVAIIELKLRSQQERSHVCLDLCFSAPLRSAAQALVDML